MYKIKQPIPEQIRLVPDDKINSDFIEVEIIDSDPKVLMITIGADFQEDCYALLKRQDAKLLAEILLQYSKTGTLPQSTSE